MRSTTVIGLFALFLFAAPALAAAESASANVAVTGTFASRTSLTVSTKLLHFDVIDPATPATASVDFAAKARTHPGSEVVLAVETAQSPGGARTAGKANRAAQTVDAITFEGAGEGTTSGVLGSGSPAVAGRWTGSGQRTGRLIFTLYATNSGSYSVPVKFVLTAP